LFAILWLTSSLVKKSFTIGITGGSGSGKTFFLDALSARFSPDQLCLISQDNYYKPRDQQPVDKNLVKNFDLPESIERETFYEDLLALKRGEVVKRTEYTFNNPGKKPRVLEFRPAPIIVAEGLFVQYFNEIVAELDLRVFVEAKDHVKFGRRIQRDRIDRGYDLDDVLYRYQQHVMPVFESLIEPLKHQADIVIPSDHGFDRALDVVAGYLKGLL